MKTARMGSATILPADPAIGIQCEFTPHKEYQWIDIGGMVTIHFCGPEDFTVFARTMRTALDECAAHLCGQMHEERKNEEG